MLQYQSLAIRFQGGQLQLARGRALSVPGQVLRVVQRLGGNILTGTQERLLQLLSVQGGMAPAEIRETLGVSKQGAMDAINPLIGAGLIEKVGSHKSGRYRLKSL